MNVNLSPQLEDMVRQKVTSGLYTSASEVVREALRLMEEKDQLRAIKLEQLRQDIRDGLNSGEPTPWDAEEIKREGRERLAAKTPQAARRKWQSLLSERDSLPVLDALENPPAPNAKLLAAAHALPRQP
jgi:antitoxin ParD1/3/4